MNVRVAIVTRALAPYHKALQEPFAESVAAAGGAVRIFYPMGTASAFDYAKTLPRATALSVEHVPSLRVPPALMKCGMRWKTEANESRLPSRAMWKALNHFDPHLVWVHELSPYSLAGLLWAKWHGRPVVFSTDIGRDNQQIFTPRACLWHRWWGLLADGVIACTMGAIRPMCKQPMPVVTAFHAADSRRLMPRAVNVPRGQPLRIIQTARVIYLKGVDLLLAALSQLRDEGVRDWQLKLLGKDQDGWGARQIELHQLGKQVEITGHLDGDALWEHFASADVFVLATRSDTYGAVVHEAACLGLPLIVSKHAGAAEALVKDGVNGFIIDPEEIDAFASCLKKLFDTKLCAEMSAAARLTGEEFSAHVRGQAVWEWMQNHFIRIQV